MTTTIFPFLSVESGWFEKIMTAARLEMIELSSITSVIATEVAAVFCIIYLISLAKDIMSDSQAGGFGSIELTNLLIPLVMFFIVQNFTKVLTPLNNITNKVVSVITNEAEKISDNPNTFLEAIINDTDEVAGGEKGELVEILENDKKTHALFRGLMSRLHPGMKLLKDFNAWGFKMLEGLFCGVINFLFDIEKYIMTVYTNIHLAFLCFLGPLAFAFSILPNWRNAYKSWIASFIEVSFWKLGIAIIVMFVSLVRATVANSSEPAMYLKVGTIVIDSEAMFKAIWSAVVSWAGYKCLKNVPSLIHLAIQLSSEAASSNSGGGAIAGAIGGALATATKTAAKAGGVPLP